MINHFRREISGKTLQRVFLFAVSAAMVFFSIPAVQAAVLINEISYNPPGTDANHEWVEVVNTGPSSVDLSSWKFYQAGNHALSAYQGSLVLPAEGYAVLTGSGAVFMADHPDFSGVVVKTSFSLSNSGETIGLVDGTGSTVESVAYPTTLANGNGFTLERNSSGQWVESSVALGTPGEENGVADTPDPSPPSIGPGDVLINEFSAAPSSGQNEWIELYNFSGREINLSQLTISDASGSSHALSGVLPAGGYAVIEPSPVSLNNAGDLLILRRASDGFVIDVVAYGSAYVPGTGSGSGIVASSGFTLGEYPDSALTGSGTQLSAFPSPTKGAFNAVDNHAPAAVITIQSPFDVTGIVPFTLNVTGESSTDPDGDPLSYRWEYGDGTVSTAENPLAKDYSSPGTYTLRLTVTDPWGASSLATQSITVTPRSSGSVSVSSTVSAPTCSSRVSTARVTINEILPNPTGSDTTSEFVELYNDEPLPVNVCGWSLDDGEGGSTAHTFGSDTFIPARGYRTFFISETGLTLNNDKDAVRLFSPEGRETGNIPYIQSPEGRSFSRFVEAGQDVWKWTTPSPDQGNVLPPQVDGEDLNPTGASDVRISEVLPDPTGLDREGEFIELENVGERTELKGYQLRLGKSHFTFEEDAFMEPGTFLSLPYSRTRLALTNAGGVLELIDPLGHVVDRLEYGKASEGHSFALFAADWGWTIPTPGEANRDEPPIGGPDLPASSDFSVRLKQGKQLLYLQGQTLPDADIALKLFLLDPSGEPVYDEPDLELTAHSSMKRGSFSTAMQVVLDPGTYLVLSTIRPRGQETFTDDTQTISITSDAVQAKPKAVKPKKRAAKKKAVSKAKTVSFAKADTRIISGEPLDEPYIGGTTAEDAMGQDSNAKRYLYTGLILFTLTGLGTIVWGKKSA